MEWEGLVRTKRNDRKCLITSLSTRICQTISFVLSMKESKEK